MLEYLIICGIYAIVGSIYGSMLGTRRKTQSWRVAMKAPIPFGLGLTTGLLAIALVNGGKVHLVTIVGTACGIIVTFATCGATWLYLNRHRSSATVIE